MTDDLVKRLQIGWHDEDTPPWVSNAMSEAKTRIEALTADFALQVQRTDEQREAYEQALSVMEAENARLREVVLEADKLLCGDLAGLQWKRECRSFLVLARAVLKGESHE